MTLTEMETKLQEMNVPPDFYGLTGGVPHNVLCIEKADVGWDVYFSERGSKWDVEHFGNESEACDRFLERALEMVRYSWHGSSVRSLHVGTGDAHVRVSDVPSLRVAVMQALEELPNATMVADDFQDAAKRRLERVLGEIDSSRFTPKDERKEFMSLVWMLTDQDSWPGHLADLFRAIETYYVRRLP
jgi:hypothetical protein